MKLREKLFSTASFCLLLTSCGEVPTLKGDQLGLRNSPTEKARQDSSSSGKKYSTQEGESLVSDLRFICSDGSSYSSLLTASLAANSEAFASRILMRENLSSKDLIFNVKQPVLTSLSRERMSFLFEGSRFHSLAAEGDLFLRHIFLGHYDFETRQSSSEFMVNVKDVHPEAKGRASEMGMSLKLYGRAESSLILPIHLPEISMYEWTDLEGQISLGAIPCSPEVCFNPVLSVDSRWAALQVFSETRKIFEVGVFERGKDFDFIQHSLPLEGEALQPQFVGTSELAWIEQNETGYKFVILNLSLMQRKTLSLIDNENSNIRFKSWSPSLALKSFHFLFADDEGSLKIASLTSSEDQSLKIIDLDIASIQDGVSEVYDFEAIDLEHFLVSASTAFGPRLFKITAENEAQLTPITRTNCASFSIGVQGDGHAI